MDALVNGTSIVPPLAEEDKPSAEEEEVVARLLRMDLETVSDEELKDFVLHCRRNLRDLQKKEFPDSSSH